MASIELTPPQLTDLFFEVIDFISRNGRFSGHELEEGDEGHTIRLTADSYDNADLEIDAR